MHLYRGTLKNLTVFFIITTFLAIVVFAAHHSLPWYICIRMLLHCMPWARHTMSCMHACIHTYIAVHTMYDSETCTTWIGCIMVLSLL